jgi:hypothetical protein
MQVPLACGLRRRVGWQPRTCNRAIVSRFAIVQQVEYHENDRRLLQVRRILRVGQDGRIPDRSHTRGLSGISRSNTPGLDRRSAAKRSPSATPR